MQESRFGRVWIAMLILQTAETTEKGVVGE